jgi:hypothetical protein
VNTARGKSKSLLNRYNQFHERCFEFLFSENAIGTPGNTKRRFFSGPGMDNYDMALLKNVRVTESKSLQFRLEGFNIFNHAQFFGPQSVDGNISSTTFGNVVNAAAPRLAQASLKFLF